MASNNAPPYTTEAAGGVDLGQRSRPLQAKGLYPVRRQTYYQFTDSDMRAIGIAQFVTTVTASIGTFGLSYYLDSNKDIVLTKENGGQVPTQLSDLTDYAFWIWVVFWAFAFIAFLWRKTEISRIKAEHGEANLAGLIGRIWSRICHAVST